VDKDQKIAACRYLKSRFPWLKNSQVFRIVNYSSYRGAFKHWRGDLSTIGLSCIERLALENRLRAEGLAMKNYTPKAVRTDRVLMGYKKSKEFDMELFEKKYGILPYERDEVDDLLG